MSWLLRLYPRAWRRRYGAEIEEVVASQPGSLQLFIDLLGGAVDAHLKPQALVRRLQEQAADGSGGSDMVYRLFTGGCGRSEMTRKEALLSAAFTLLAALGMAGILIVDNRQMTQAIVLSVFPAISVLPVQWIYLRGHSMAAKVVLLLAPLLICFLIGLSAGYVATR